MAEMAFEKLKAAASGLSTKPANPAEADIPFCLLKDVELKFFPCLVCAKLFRSIRDLIDHGEVHQMGNEWPDGAVYCCFCGVRFPSKAALILHQTPKIAPKMSCSGCERNFSKETLETHVCPLSSGRSDCPLECGFRMEDGAEMDSHLKLAHGCENKVEISILKHSNQIANCPMCGERFNDVGKTGLDFHLAMYCPRVGEIQKSFLRSIYNGAKEDGMHPDIVLTQELESSLFEVLTCLEKMTKSNSVNDDDGSVAYLTYILNKVYSEDFKQFLIDAVSWESNRIYEQYDKLREDFLLMFQIWSASVQYSLDETQDVHRLASLYEQTVENETLRTLTGGPFSTVVAKESVVYLSEFEKS